MIDLLLPLGLLGLLGIVALIIIYIIKPNYQVKYISSTYVWKLSLKYRKKRPPTSNIRNILLFLCQLLILTVMAGILAQPVLKNAEPEIGSSVIAVIDSSASMYAARKSGTTSGPTRFERAVSETKELLNEVVDAGGKFSVIIADDSPEFLGREVTSSNKSLLTDDLDALANTENACAYGTADIEGALVLCKPMLEANPATRIYLYTDVDYAEVPENITLVRMSDQEGASGEWNGAILDARAEVEDGYYVLSVDIAVYGRDVNVGLKAEISGANSLDAEDAGKFVSVSRTVFCASDAVQTVVFRNGGGQDEGNLFYYDLGDANKFFSYQSIRLTLDCDDDSFFSDNAFDLYGGQKEVIRVEYASTDPNPFFNSGLGSVRNHLASRYDLQITEIKKGEDPILEGFDFYIFEHKMPREIPTDGVILLADPDPYYGEAPINAGFRVAGTADFQGRLTTLAEGSDFEGHPVTKYLWADEIAVSLYNVISDYDPSFDVLLSYGNDPMLMARNDGANQLAVMAFSVHYSNISKLPEHFLIFNNLFDWYLPSVVDGNAFEVNESIALQSRGEKIVFTGQDGSKQTILAEELPKSITLSLPGTYTVDQTTYFGKDIPTQRIFVKIPAAESNIFAREDELYDPYEGTEKESLAYDLLTWLAAALVALLFAEWLLQALGNK